MWAAGPLLISALKQKGCPGLIIHISPETAKEIVYIPACVTHGAIDDLVYNDFYVGPVQMSPLLPDAVSTQTAGIRHDIMAFTDFSLESGAHVLYKENTWAQGQGPVKNA